MGVWEKLISQPATIALAFIVIIYAIKEGYELFKWWKGRADDYHGSRKAEEDFPRQVCEIACTSQEHTETLKKIGDALDGINERLDKSEEDRRKDLELANEERKKDTIANSRAWLYNLYEQLKDKPNITVNEYETFNDLAERYLAAGGNSVFKDKIIPEIRKKPIDETI